MKTLSSSLYSWVLNCCGVQLMKEDPSGNKNPILQKGKVISQENIVSGSKVFNELVFQCYTCYEDPDGDMRKSPVCMEHCFSTLIERRFNNQNMIIIFNTKQSQITYSLKESALFRGSQH